MMDIKIGDKFEKNGATLEVINIHCSATPWIYECRVTKCYHIHSLKDWKKIEEDK